MEAQTLDGEIHDQRVIKCGVTIEGDTMKTIRPFVETSGKLAGKIVIKVQSRSGSNSNFTTQTVGFPGSSSIAVGRPTNIKIDMVAMSDDVQLCSLAKSIDFDDQGIRI